MGQVQYCWFNDQPLRDELVCAQMRLRYAAMIAKRLDLRKRVTVLDFLTQAICAQPQGFSRSDLVAIGDCFNLNASEIDVGIIEMIALRRASFDKSLRFGLPPDVFFS